MHDNTKLKNKNIEKRKGTLKMKDEVDTVMGFLDIPPYVTMVPPILKGKFIRISR